MAQHGYLGDDYGSEYDPNYDSDDDRERSWRGGEQRGNWRGRGDDDRRFMFDRGERDRSWDRDDHRGGGGTFSGMADRARSWFSDDDDRERGQGRGGRSDADEWFGGRSSGQRHQSSGYGREHGWAGSRVDYRQRQDQQRQPSGHQDDHYRSWREKQMEAMDREYADYCREREQQFHSDFDSWRQKRQQSQGQQQGTGQQGGSSSETMELNNPTRLSGETQASANPVGDATLGTNNAENSATARRGR